MRFVISIVNNEENDKNILKQNEKINGIMDKNRAQKSKNTISYIR